MLAISQIEVAVKTFWGDIYKRMPKPEIGNVGATFRRVRSKTCGCLFTLNTIIRFKMNLKIY